MILSPVFVLKWWHRARTWNDTKTANKKHLERPNTRKEFRDKQGPKGFLPRQNLKSLGVTSKKIIQNWLSLFRNKNIPDSLVPLDKWIICVSVGHRAPNMDPTWDLRTGEDDAVHFYQLFRGRQLVSAQQQIVLLHFKEENYIKCTFCSENLFVYMFVFIWQKTLNRWKTESKRVKMLFFLSNFPTNWKSVFIQMFIKLMNKFSF